MRQRRMLSSLYMQFAKATAQQVKYNLASSGVMNYRLADLPVTFEDLELTGDSYYGYRPLQEALAKHCGVSTAHVFATIGTSLANHIAMAAVLEPGDEVLIENPTYELLTSTLGYLGANLKRFPRQFENGFAIDAHDVEKAISPKTRLIVITNLHNPSSVLTDEATLRQIGEIARSAGAFVLVDEVYLDAAFELRPRSAIHLGSEFIVTSSLTKVYGLSGLRCGWVLAQPDLIRRMWHLNDLFNSIPAHPAERLSVIALHYLDKIRSWSRSLLERNHQILNRFLDSRPELETVRPEIGTVVFPRLTTGGVEKLSSLLTQKYETAIAPGKYFGADEHFRIGIGGASDVLEEGVVRLGFALNELSAVK